MGYATFTMIDHVGMTSRVRLKIADATGETLDAQKADIIAGAGTLYAALAGVSDCVIGKSELSAAENSLSSTNSAVTSCFRQAGLLVRFSDEVDATKYHVTIPGPKYASLTVLAHDEVDIAAGPMVDLVAAFERAVLSGNNNAVTVTGARIVGRSN